MATITGSQPSISLPNGVFSTAPNNRGMFLTKKTFSTTTLTNIVVSESINVVTVSVGETLIFSGLVGNEYVYSEGSPPVGATFITIIGKK